MRAMLFVGAVLVAGAAVAGGLSLGDPSYLAVVCRIPATTNVALQSQTLEHASWTKGAVAVTANATAAPDATTTAEALVADGTSTGHFISQAMTATATTWTISAYAKAGNQPSLLIFDDVSSVAWCWNLATGTSLGRHTGLGSGITGAIVSAGGGWYRISATYTATAAARGIYLIASDDADSCGSGDEVFTGNSATANTYLWNVQYEAQSSATPYVLTTTVPVSRAFGPCS